MKKFETLHLVKQEDLNHHGTLFAARAAEWLIEAGFAVAACEHGNTDEVVMRNLQDLSYFSPTVKGTVLKLVGRVVLAGETSLMVVVTGKDALTDTVKVEGYMTFVTIDAVSGKKKSHGIVLDEAEDGEESNLRAKAIQLRNQRTR